MSKPCIAIDVSQDKSTVLGCIDSNQFLNKPTIIYHDKIGFERISKLRKDLIDKTGEIPLIIFEYTGIYHRTLEQYCINNNFEYHIVSPLLSAKSRQKVLRSVKTDVKDSYSLAKMFYSDNLGKFYQPSYEYQELKDLSRTYEKINHILQETKVTFRECLATIYPKYEISKRNTLGAFKCVYSNESLEFLKLYPYPTIFINESKDKTLENISKFIATSHSSYVTEFYQRLFSYCSNVIPGCYQNSIKVTYLSDYANEIQTLSNKLDSIIELMIKIAKDIPEFDLYKTIPCIQDNLAARLVAELGDISRFSSYRSMIAFAGTDSIIDQSGDKTGEHGSISKKGNKVLRKILYLMVNQLIKAKNFDSNIKDFYKKKTQQGKPSLVASVACCNKLLQTIYYMHKNNCAYKH